jgi:DNA replication protein DnaC
MPEELCPICEGAGLRIVERADGTRVAQECSCRAKRRELRMVAQAHIPDRYRLCTLDNFVPNYAGNNQSLAAALMQARNFVRTYPVDTDGKGLLLVGTVGLGKTHLAVGILQALIAERGAKGLFCDYRDLLKQIQDSYGRNDLSEREILKPVFQAEVLVIDELGAAKPTEWVWDTVQHILNTRYNDRKTTIITTNYQNEEETPPGTWDHLPEDKRRAQMASHHDTLGDRITERMRSRLQEMCVVVEMMGKDFRKSKPGRASFANRKYTAKELFASAKAEEDRSEKVDELSDNSAPEALESKSKVDPVSGSLPISREKKKLVSAEKKSSLMPPERIWTQADIDRAVALKTAKQNERLEQS